MALSFPKLKSRAILAPMSGVTDVAFRELARKFGTGLTYTEFVSGTAIVRGNSKSEGMLRLSPLEVPSAAQLFGSSFEDVRDAARSLSKDFDIIDINCGCPAYKVVKTGAGSALLQNPKDVGRLIKMLVDSVNSAITLKIRIGIDERHINAVEVARIAQESGASAITVHARTQKQGYRGTADWEVIKKVKESVEMPVIGNGDISSPEDAKRKLEDSGADYLMIGRAAMGNPYLFRQINDFLEYDEYDSMPRIQQFEQYLRIAKEYQINFSALKNHALSFTKGMVGGAKLRREISQSKSVESICGQLTSFTRR